MIYCIYGICTNFIQMWLLLQKIIHEPIFFDPWCVGLVVECWCVFYVFLLPKTHPLPPQPSCKALVRLHPQRRDRNPIRKPDPFSSPMFFFRGKLGVKRQGGFFHVFFFLSLEWQVAQVKLRTFFMIFPFAKWKWRALNYGWKMLKVIEFAFLVSDPKWPWLTCQVKLYWRWPALQALVPPKWRESWWVIFPKLKLTIQRTFVEVTRSQVTPLERKNDHHLAP